MKNLKFIIAIVLGFIFSGCNQQEELILPKDLPAFDGSGEYNFDQTIFNENYKLVIITKSLYLFSLPFMENIRTFSDVPIIIYVVGNNETEIIDALKLNNFQNPVIHDINGVIIKENNLYKKLNRGKTNSLFSLLLHDNKIKGSINILMKELLEQELKSTVWRDR